jgi:hypothetical protein
MWDISDAADGVMCLAATALAFGWPWPGPGLAAWPQPYFALASPITTLAPGTEPDIVHQS